MKTSDNFYFTIKKLSFWVVGVGMIFLSTLSQATPLYVADTKTGQANLSNSGDATELTAIENATGNFNLTLLMKVKTPNGAPAQINFGATDQFFIDIALNQPIYFLLKFGIGGTTATANTFFFHNIGELSALVWKNSDVQFLSGGNCARNPNACNIGRLSHYNIYVDPRDIVVAAVPEPMPLYLIVIGLLGICLVRRNSSAT